MDAHSRQTLRPTVWLEEHGDALYRYALARTGRRDVAQDLVQDTLLAAWVGRDGFQGGSSERTWLLGICRHKTLDYFRRSARDEFEPLGSPSDTAEEAEFFNRRGLWRDPPAAWARDPLGAAEADAFLSVLQRCLDGLPVAQRDSFMLRALGDVDADDASHALEVSPNHLYVLLHRARLRLRRCLDKHWFEGTENKP